MSERITKEIGLDVLGRPRQLFVNGELFADIAYDELSRVASVSLNRRQRLMRPPRRQPVTRRLGRETWQVDSRNAGTLGAGSRRRQQAEGADDRRRQQRQ